MKKRVFLIIFVLILTAVPASAATDPDRIADTYNDYAAVFSAPACNGVAKADDRFIQLDLPDGPMLVVSADLTYAMILSSDGESVFRAAVSILSALADGNDVASIISGCASAFLMLDANLYTAGPFLCKFEISPAGEYVFSALKN